MRKPLSHWRVASVARGSYLLWLMVTNWPWSAIVVVHRVEESHVR